MRGPCRARRRKPNGGSVTGRMSSMSSSALRSREIVLSPLPA
jgi:hypothetical protein